ncbi:MAG: DUF2666 domain-containing protein [Candidatus Micrarchaeota archaeon]|nr:DUF2666 domain-containing protein [Candidatus Micrarchaeota archaeon]
MFDESKDQIVFVAKHRDWIVIKKLLIDQHVKNEEIGLILSSIQKSINEKSFSYFEVNYQKIREIAKKFVTNKRKGLATVGEIFSSIKGAELKKELLSCCSKEDHYPLAEQLFVLDVLDELGYSPYPNLEVIQKLYPELKIQKPKGNFGKKK